MGIKHGYYNVADPMECYRADFIIDCYADAQFGVLAKAAFNPDFQDPEKQGPIMEDCVAKGLCALLTQVEKQLTATGAKWVAGDKLTIADCVLSAFYHTNISNKMSPFNGPFNAKLEEFPKSKAYFDCIATEFKCRADKLPASPF